MTAGAIAPPSSLRSESSTMIRFRPLAALAAGALLPSMAAAQTMPGMDHRHMKGMKMPAQATKPVPPKPKRPAVRATPPVAARPQTPQPVPPAPVADPHHEHAMPAPSTPPVVDQVPVEAAPPPSSPPHHAMPGMTHGGHDAMPGMAAGGHAMTMGLGAGAYQNGSGTARLPGAEEMRGQHLMAGDWMMMAHGFAWGAFTDQGGPRGQNQAFVTSMAMLTAQRDLSPTTHLQLRTMLSAEPLMSKRGYPNLFATGETADGRTLLIDRQHPHDLFMELSARIDIDAGPGSVFLYGGPVGEPAIGPSAFMMRASAKYQTLAPITHHWFDSTHIVYGVVTAGYAAPTFQIEASAFRGREPDQYRWDIEAPALDSWSVRASWTPTPAFAMQVSHGFLKTPEQLEPELNERRTTASAHYARGGLTTMVAFSAKDKGPNRTLTAWLAEANWDMTRHHSLFGRVENVANDELFPDDADPLHDQRFRVTKLEGGYAYRMRFIGPTELALGGSVAGYAYPSALRGAYGDTPISYTLFAKLTLID